MASAENVEWEYDVFISYVRFDERVTGVVKEVVARLNDGFRMSTGRDLRVFLDTESVPASTLWERRIDEAIRGSALLLVFQSPSYLTSEWCAREYDAFCTLEIQRRRDYNFRPSESLIFPVIVRETENSQSAGDRHARHEDLRRHQAVDISDAEIGGEAFATLLGRLVADLIHMLRKVERQTPDASVTPLVATRSGITEAKLTADLAGARTAIIVGVTNSWLANCLEPALEARRADPEVEDFWDELSIVFLADEVLPFVHDELAGEFAAGPQALRERIQRAGLVKRQVMSLLLREGRPGRWTLYSYPYMLPLTGNLFVRPDGHRTVQLALAKPMQGESESLYIDLLDRVDQSFDATFRDIVDNSREEHEVVLVGTPRPGTAGFICRSARFRRSVLVPGRNLSDWLPAIVALTWRSAPAGPEPLLQINTPTSSTREMGKASHVSGYVNQRDCPLRSDASASDFELGSDAVLAAVRRELRADFGIVDVPSAAAVIDQIPFYYFDKENLFFYLLHQELSASHAFSAASRMFGWTVEELVSVRAYQVLGNVLPAFATPMTATQRRRALDLLGHNLRAHGEVEVARTVAEAAGLNAAPEALRELVADRLGAATTCKYSGGQELVATGLAGLQYRAFFSHLLPFYASIGVPGASDLLAEVRDDRRRAEAVRALGGAYLDGNLVTSLPMEM